jgi:hypothetical protein
MALVHSFSVMAAEFYFYNPPNRNLNTEQALIKSDGAILGSNRDNLPTNVSPPLPKAHKHIAICAEILSMTT